MTIKPNIYKMRCESVGDAMEFLERWFLLFKDKTTFNIETDGYMGCTLSITTNKSLETIEYVIKLINDSHVMLETLKPLNLYTGNR